MANNTYGLIYKIGNTHKTHDKKTGRYNIFKRLISKGLKSRLLFYISILCMIKYNFTKFNYVYGFSVVFFSKQKILKKYLNHGIKNG